MISATNITVNSNAVEKLGIAQSFIRGCEKLLSFVCVLITTENYV